MIVLLWMFYYHFWQLYWNTCLVLPEGSNWLGIQQSLSPTRSLWSCSDHSRLAWSFDAPRMWASSTSNSRAVMPALLPISTPLQVHCPEMYIHFTRSACADIELFMAHCEESSVNLHQSFLHHLISHGIKGLREETSVAHLLQSKRQGELTGSIFKHL